MPTANLYFPRSSFFFFITRRSVKIKYHINKKEARWLAAFLCGYRDIELKAEDNTISVDSFRTCARAFALVSRRVAHTHARIHAGEIVDARTRATRGQAGEPLNKILPYSSGPGLSRLDAFFGNTQRRHTANIMITADDPPPSPLLPLKRESREILDDILSNVYPASNFRQIASLRVR